MGNTLCDRLFLNLSDGDSISAHWSAEDQDSLASNASLSAEGRARKLDMVKNNIDPEMIRFYQASQNHRELDYSLQASAEMSELLPLINPQITVRWSLDQSATILKELGRLVKDATNSQTIVNEMNYLTHIYLLYQNYTERKRKTENLSKSQLIKEVVEVWKKGRQTSLETGKDKFINTLITVTIDGLQAIADSIIKTKDQQTLSKFIGKCVQMSAAFSPEDRANAEETEVNESIEKFVRSIIGLVETIRKEASSRELQVLVETAQKLAFYLGRTSLHLKIFEILLRDDLHLSIKVGGFKEAVELKGFKHLKIGTTARDSELRLPEEVDENDGSFCVVADEQRLILNQNKGVAVYNRFSNYGIHTPIFSCRTELSQMSYCEGVIIGSTDPKRPEMFEEITCDAAARTADPSSFYNLSRPSSIDKSCDERLKLLSGLKYSSVKSWVVASQKDQFVVLTKYQLDSKPNVYSVQWLTCTRDQNKCTCTRELGVFRDDKLVEKIGVEDELQANAAYFGGLLLLFSPSKGLAVINPETGELLSEGHVLDQAIRGVDSVRRKLFYSDLPKHKLNTTDVDSYLRYDYSSSKYPHSGADEVEGGEAKVEGLAISVDDSFDEGVAETPASLTSPLPAPQPVCFLSARADKIEEQTVPTGLEDYMRTLAKLSFSAHYGPMTLEMTAISSSEYSKLLLQPNKIEVRLEVFGSIHNVLALVLSSAPSTKKYFLTLSILKILDSHLNVAFRLQNSEKTDSKVLNQEFIAKLRKLVVKATLPRDSPTHNLAAFDELKLNLLKNLLDMSTQVKNPGPAKAYADLLISSSAIQSHGAVSKMLVELFKLKSKKCLTFQAFIDGLMAQIKAQIGVQLDMEKEAMAAGFSNPTSSTTRISRTVGVNLRTLFSVFIGCRGSFDEDILYSLVQYSLGQLGQYVEALGCAIEVNRSNLRDKPSCFGDFENEFINSLGGFILLNTVSFLSYSTTWPDLLPSLSEICKKVAIAAKKLTFPKIPLSKGEMDNSRKEITMTIQGSTPPTVESETVYLPLYTRVTVETSGADHDFDTVVVSTVQEYDRHDIGKQKEITANLPFPHCVVRDGRPVTLNTNWINVTIIAQSRGQGNGETREVNVTVQGVEPALKNTGRLETLSRLCGQFVTQQLLKEIKQLDEKGSSLEKLSEVATISLESIFSSPLFDHGFSSSTFAQVAKTLDVRADSVIDGDGREELCRQYYSHLVATLKIEDAGEVLLMEGLCDALQTACSKKSIHGTMLGSLGFILAKSLFVVLLYQASSLKFVLTKLKDGDLKEPDEELKKIWVGCSKIRMRGREFDTDRQFQELYRKLEFLVAIPPSQRWDSQHVVSSLVKQQTLNEGVVKMKLYLEELRVNSLSPQKQDSKVLVEVMMKFLSLPVSTDQIVDILAQREKHFMLFGKGVETVMELLRENPNDLEEALLMFNQLFRKNQNSLGYLMVDYSGLDRELVAGRILSLSNLFQKILDYVTKERPENEDHSEQILLAIESFKWLWRGKELPCIQQIDINKIWAACFLQLGTNQRFRLSMIDLCFILLRFCQRKVKDLEQGEEDAPDLQLNRQASIVDEHSMASILNQNFNFLSTLLCENLDEFTNTAESLTLEDYNVILSFRNLDSSQEWLFDKILLNQDNTVEVPDLDHVLLFTRPFKLETTTVEEYEEDTEGKEVIIDEEIKVPKKEHHDGKKTREVTAISKEAKDYAEITERAEKIYKQNNSKLSRCAEEISKVLSIFYYYVYAASDMATLFFEHSENLKPLLKIAFGNFPEGLAILGLKIVEQLSAYLPPMILFSEGPTMKEIVDQVRPVYANLFKSRKDGYTPSKELKNARLSLLRSLLMSKAYSEDLIKELAGSLTSGKSEEILMAMELLDLTNSALAPGSLVYDKFDQMKEQLLLLSSTPSLFTKAYMRDILHYRFDITSDSNVSTARFDRFGLHYSRLLTVCLRTKNYSFLEKSQICQFDPQFDKEVYRSVLSKLGIEKVVSNLTDSPCDKLVKFRFCKIARLSADRSYRQIVASFTSHLQPSREQIFTEEECSFVINDLVDFVSRTHSEVLPRISKEALPYQPQSSVERYKQLKARLYSGIRAPLNRELPKLDDYWTSQFGTQALPKGGKFNYNIAYNKPSLDMPPAFDSAESLSTKNYSARKLSNTLTEGIAQVVLKFLFATREQQDTPSLARKLGQRLYLLSMRHFELAEIGEVEIMLEVILEESAKEAVFELGDSLMKEEYSQENFPWQLRLLERLSKRLRNAEFSTQYLYYLFDRVCMLTQTAEDVGKNNLLLNAYVEAMESTATLSRLLPKGSLNLDSERTLSFDSLLRRIDIPEHGDSYSFKRTHKQEYIANILIHFARSVAAGGAWQSALIQNGATLAALESLEKGLQALASQPTDDDLIRGIILDKLTFGEGNEEVFKVSLKPNQPTCPLPQLPKYSRWRVMIKDGYSVSMAICLDKQGTQLFKEINTHAGMNQDFRTLLTFQVDKSKEYFLSANIPDNFQTMNISAAAYSLVTRHAKPSSNLLSSPIDTDYMCVAGELFWLENGFHWIDSGVSAAGATQDGSYMAYYKINSRELVYFDKQYEFDKDKISSSWYKLSKSENHRTMWAVDLSAFPVVLDLCFLRNDLIAGVDERGGFFVHNSGKDTNPLSDFFRDMGVLSRETRFLTSKLSYFFNPERRVLMIWAHDSNPLYVAVIQTSEGVEIITCLASNNQQIKLAGMVARKAICDGNYLYLLTTQQRVFTVRVGTGGCPIKRLPIETLVNNMGYLDFGGIIDINSFSDCLTTIIQKQTSFNLKENKCDKADIEAVKKETSAGGEENIAESKPHTKNDSIKGSFHSGSRDGPGEFGYRVVELNDPSVEKMLTKYAPQQNSRYLRFVNANSKYWLANLTPCTYPMLESGDLAGYGKHYPVRMGISSRGVWKITQGEVQELTDKLEDTIELEFFYPYKKQSCENFRDELVEKLKEYQESEIASTFGPKLLGFGYDFKPVEANKTHTFDKELVFRLEVIGSERTGLAQLVEWLTSEAHIHSDEHHYDAYLIPDFLNLPAKEFEVFKEEYRDLWETSFSQIRPNYLKIKEEVMEMMAKKLDDDSYERAWVPEVFMMEKVITDLQEFRQYFKAEDTPVKNESQIQGVFITMAVLNYSWLQYLLTVPQYRQEWLDAEILERTQKNVFETFNCNQRRRTEYEDYRSYTMDRQRGLKHTDMKRQNLSLLNQLSYELSAPDNNTLSKRLIRLLVEGVDFNFTGESRHILTISWSRCRRTKERVPDQRDSGGHRETQVVRQVSQRSAQRGRRKR